MMIRRILVASGTIVAGGLLGQLVYRLAIVPRLNGWQAIPLVWYLPLLAPLIIGFIVAGLTIHFGREAVITASLVALVALLPGGHDSAPAVNVLGTFAITAALLSLIAWMATLIRHRATPV